MVAAAAWQWVEAVREAKVDELQCAAILGKQQIIELQVAMHDAKTVAVHESVHSDLGDLACIGFLHETIQPSSEQPLQVHACRLQYQAVHTAMNAVVEHSDHILSTHIERELREAINMKGESRVRPWR